MAVLQVLWVPFFLEPCLIRRGDAPESTLSPAADSGRFPQERSRREEIRCVLGGIWRDLLCLLQREPFLCCPRICGMRRWLPLNSFQIGKVKDLPLPESSKWSVMILVRQGFIYEEAEYHHVCILAAVSPDGLPVCG